MMFIALLHVFDTLFAGYTPLRTKVFISTTKFNPVASCFSDYDGTIKRGLFVPCKYFLMLVSKKESFGLNMWCGLLSTGWLT